MDMKDKCIIFSRVSTEKQDLEQQHETLRREAYRHNFHDEDLIYIEAKESAINKTIDEREGIIRLLEELPKARAVMVWELSRLARRADVMYQLRDEFIKTGTQLICLTPPFELLDENLKMSPTASLVLSLFTSLAESEMSMKKERMKRGMRRRIEQGYYHGGRPFFGYRPDENKRFVPDEHDAPTVRKVFTMFASGEYTFRSLGMHMRDLGLFRKISNSSCLSKVHDIINDSRYAGTSRTYPGIITISLFEKCQQAAKEHTQAAKTANRCQMLGKSVLRSKTTGYVMSCIPSSRMYQSRTDDKPMLYVPQLKVDPIIWEVSVYLYKKYVGNKAIRQKKMLEELKQISIKLKNTDLQLTDIQNKIDRLEERIVMGMISEEKAKDLRDKLGKQYKDCEQKKILYNLQASQKGQQMYDDYWDEDSGGYDNLPFMEKRKIMLSVIDEILASRTEDKKSVILEFHTKFGNNIYKTVRTKK